MKVKALLLFCTVFFVAQIKLAYADDVSGLGNNTTITASSSSSSSFNYGDYCCSLNKEGDCCTYGSCCGKKCCGKDDQCFFDKCINTGGLSRTVSIIIAVAVVVVVIIIIVLLIGWCCCCCKACCKKKEKVDTKRRKVKPRETASSDSTAVELEEGKGADASTEAAAPHEKTEEELEAERKQKEWESKFNSLMKPIMEILDIYTMDKTNLEDATEMMIFVVIKYYMDIEHDDQETISLYTTTGTKVFEGIYAKFHSLIPGKEKNAFIENVFGNVAEKRTEIKKACEGDFTSALESASKAIKAASLLVKSTALTQDRAIVIIGSILATIFRTRKMTESKNQDQDDFSSWYDGLKLYLPKAHADYIKAASWEFAFESLD